MSTNLINPFSGFGTELLERLRADYRDRLNDAAFEEKIIGIENATSAMLELNVSEEQIIQMLQKYWDLRLSEARLFISKQKESI
ncbi:MAG: hypothetical protein IJ192_02950 [Clostridia bacterium]|nr:hypothetical protein [Clostridia bacterium]